MRRVLLISLVFPLILTPVIFSLCALADGMSFAETVSAVVEQYQVSRRNLLVASLPGYFPILLLFLCLWIYRRSKGDESTRQKMAWAGLAAIVLVLIWANWEFWSVFLPGKTYPGFPHGLELIIGAGYFAPIAMLGAMFIAWLIFRKKKN